MEKTLLNPFSMRQYTSHAQGDVVISVTAASGRFVQGQAALLFPGIWRNGILVGRQDPRGEAFPVATGKTPHPIAHSRMMTSMR